MELRDRATILALKSKLAADVNVVDIEDVLISSQIINREDKQRIHSSSSTEAQTSTLVDILLEKNNRKTFECLLSSLKESYSFLYEEIVKFRQSPQAFLKKPDKEDESVFIEGGIPVTPQGNIELPVMTELKNHLVKLSDLPDGGWILVKGQGGAGKTVMVAQAIRGAAEDGSPIAGFFFNRVFWFTIGQLRSDEWESMLLTKMQNICIRLDPDTRSSPPENLDRAADLLRSIMLKKYPCGLIVLDDVWEPKILRYFNVQARIVVTSRSADIFSRIQCGRADRCKVVSVEEGLTEDSTIRLLSEIINTDNSARQVSDQFSTEDVCRVKKLHSMCKGNPFIISIFGGLLRGRLSQFERYLKKFELDLFDNTRIVSGDYEYRSITEAILVSIDDLDPINKEHFLQLSIFPEDSFLSPRFLSTYCWQGVDEDEALDIMEFFVRRSIATIEKDRADSSLLTLHDLIVRAMKYYYKEKRTSYNNQFVERVWDHRKSKSSWLEIDDSLCYLAYSFVYHLVSADVITLKQKLGILQEFDFISWLCFHIGADNLAYVYQYCVKCLQVEADLSGFVTFFRSSIFKLQATYLSARRSDSAVIQLALTLPEDNSVRRHAEVAVRDHKHFFCFYAWLNYSQTNDQIHSTFKIDPDVKFFALDSQSNHGVVASDSSVVLLDLSSGMSTYCISKDDMLVCKGESNPQDNCQVVSALFSTKNDYLFVLTENALIRYKLPPSALDSKKRPSPAAPLPSEVSSLHFPPGRPKGAKELNSTFEPIVEKQVYSKAGHSDSYFTAMCIYDEAKLILGCNDGQLVVLTLTDSLINASSDFIIDGNISLDSKINHIAVSLPSSDMPHVAVCGPNNIVYVYESSYSIRQYKGHTKNNPLQCTFEPRKNPRFAVTIAENEIVIWNPATLETLSCELGPSNTSFTSIAISPDAGFLAVGTSTRAHIYLYRLDLNDSSIGLQLVDELNGSGSFTKSLHFTTLDKSLLYSVSEMFSEGVLTCWKASFDTTPLPTEDQRHSSFFFPSDGGTLLLQTLFDAVTVKEGEIIVACQSVRSSLLILKSISSNGTGLCKADGGNFRKADLREATAIRMASNGKYAVFTFSNEVIIAQEFNRKWCFIVSQETLHISDVVFLPDCQGFIGSDKSGNLVLYHGSTCTQRAEFSHKRLLSVNIVSSNAQALLLSDRRWGLLSVDSFKLKDINGELNTLPGSLLCCDSCPLQHGYVAGGTDLGTLIVWQVDGNDSVHLVGISDRPESESGNCSLRCVGFSHQIQDFCLLAGAFDDSRFSLWSVRDGHLSNLVSCQPVQLGVQLQSSEIGCIAWTMHTNQDNCRHHKLIIASDCVHVCCLSEQEILTSIQSGNSETLRPTMVSLYSRQSVTKAQILNNGQDLLFIDNSHTVFWMRTLHTEQRSAPQIPFGDSSEQF